MGTTVVKLIFKNPKELSKTAEGDFLVDSGAHYTVLPKRFVKKLGLTPEYTQEFSLADGKIVKRPIGAVVVKLHGRELPIPVVLGETGDSALLGVTTLKTFGLMLDPFQRKIYPSKLILASLKPV